MLELFRYKTIRGKFFLLTTVIIVIPMLVLSFTVYHISAQKLGENALHNAQSSLNMGGLYLDRSIIDLYDLLDVIQGNPQIQLLLTSGYTDETERNSVQNEDFRYIRNLENVRDIVNAITLSKPYISSFLIYTYDAPPDKRIYNSSGNGQSISITSGQAESWKQQLSDQDTIIWRDGEMLEQNELMRQNSIVVGKKLKKLSGGYGDLGFILLEIDKDQFFNGLQFLRPTLNSHYFIMDAEGKPIFKFADSSLSIRQLKHPDNRYIVQSIPNDRTGWQLTHVMESSQLYKDARVIRSITITVFLLLLVIGWLLALWLSNTVSRPLKELSNLIRVGKKDTKTLYVFDATDEVGQIGIRFLRMTEENKELHQQVYTALLKRKEAEIEALQAQINPHFLYNTLESLNWLAISRNQFEISEIIGALGKFFRVAIRKGSDMITVADELEHVRAYVKVQRFRYKDKFDFDTEIEDTLMRDFVPKFIFQPVVENCIYHGLKQKQESGNILISGEDAEDGLYFRITDDGIGITPERLQEVRDALKNEANSTIYGIKNVNDRIQLMFGSDYGVSIDSQLGVFTTVTIKLPKISDSDKERPI